jgi:hypothetical protein
MATHTLINVYYLDDDEALCLIVPNHLIIPGINKMLAENVLTKELNMQLNSWHMYNVDSTRFIGKVTISNVYCLKEDRDHNLQIYKSDEQDCYWPGW